MALSEPRTVTFSRVRADFRGSSQGSSGAHIAHFLVHDEPVQVKMSRSGVPLFDDCLTYIIITKMETDRAQTDLGEAANAELSASKSDPVKQPKKRFIGRKAAAEKAEKNGGSNGTIEDSGAIQGLQTHGQYYNH